MDSWTNLVRSRSQILFFFSSLFFWLPPEACGILVPWAGIEPAPTALEGRVLTTGPGSQGSPRSQIGFWKCCLRCQWDIEGENPLAMQVHCLLQGIFLTRDSTCFACISCITGGCFTHWATREAHWKSCLRCQWGIRGEKPLAMQIWNSEKNLGQDM